MLWLVALLQASVFAAPSPPAVVPWKPPPSLLARIREVVPEKGPGIVRLRILHRHLVSPRGLAIRQVSDWSGSSREVSRLGRADCVGFAYLLGGLARELGLDTGFAVSEPSRPATPTRFPGLGVREAHVVVTLRGAAGELWSIDHAGLRRVSGSRLRALEDEEAAALLASNRVARALQRGDCPGALRAARIAGGELSGLGGDLVGVLQRRCRTEKYAGVTNW